MKLKLIEATNAEGGGGMNWGKFAVGRLTEDEWAVASVVSPTDGMLRRGVPSLIAGRGWSRQHVFVLDLQTGEGALFLHGGYARHDLNKRKIWVCPMFEPFLRWLYKQDVSDLDALPSVVFFTEAEAPSAMTGYRRPGPRQRRASFKPRPTPKTRAEVRRVDPDPT